MAPDAHLCNGPLISCSLFPCLPVFRGIVQLRIYSINYVSPAAYTIIGAPIAQDEVLRRQSFALRID
ncbi:hypothetical protein KIN20_023969 [Parelaphostrongylus tenuis]|uniref:Uncharacterized protein n=1 Tax=Parelaphostrongylus tenuis TaxID=148309 RepID=A0AAD5QTB0_PARTN|nr:hypothetical protein KIN20_023969 [Parelaphostrongylus tenuis]